MPPEGGQPGGETITVTVDDLVQAFEQISQQAGGGPTMEMLSEVNAKLDMLMQAISGEGGPVPPGEMGAAGEEEIPPELLAQLGGSAPPIGNDVPPPGLPGGMTAQASDSRRMTKSNRASKIASTIRHLRGQ